jgi:hypothetical protein
VHHSIAPGSKGGSGGGCSRCPRRNRDWCGARPNGSGRVGQKGGSDGGQPGKERLPCTMMKKDALDKEINKKKKKEKIRELMTS